MKSSNSTRNKSGPKAQDVSITLVPFSVVWTCSREVIRRNRLDIPTEFRKYINILGPSASILAHDSSNESS